MANICTQNLYIFADTKEDMKALLIKMAEHFKAAIGKDCLPNISENSSWNEYVNKMTRASSNYNMLAFLSDEPDTRAESGDLYSGEAYGKPYVVIEMGLKWGPSFQVAEFCNDLNSNKYGCATINGGEYMCAMGDEIAYIQWGTQLESPFDGGIEYQEYVMQQRVNSSKSPKNLQDMAILKLFEREYVGVYFWSHEDDVDCSYEELASYNSEKPYGSSISWNNPNSESGRKEVDSYLLDFVQEFPKELKFTCQDYDNTNKYLEGVGPYAPLMMKSYWTKGGQYSNDKLHVDICDIDGNKLGALSQWYNCDNYFGFAYLTPYLSITAKDIITPKTALKKRKTGQFVAHIELVPFDFNEVLDSVHERAELPLGERACESIVEERG